MIGKTIRLTAPLPKIELPKPEIVQIGAHQATIGQSIGDRNGNFYGIVISGDDTTVKIVEYRGHELFVTGIRTDLRVDLNEHTILGTHSIIARTPTITAKTIAATQILQTAKNHEHTIYLLDEFDGQIDIILYDTQAQRSRAVRVLRYKVEQWMHGKGFNRQQIDQFFERERPVCFSVTHIR